MRIAVHDVSKGKKGHALPTTSLEIETGHARFVLAETELRPTVLGLIATGRMRPDTGEVTIDGTRNDRDLRRRMALVDAPEVSDPHPGVTLAAVVGEELMFAGLPATPLHARRWLEQIGFAELAAQPIGTIKPSVRVRVMAELAVLRDDVEGFVLVSPDRHGGRPEGWWRIATEFAERGFAVLVIVGGSAAAVIERLPEALETDYPTNATVPVRPLADITGSTVVLPVEDADHDVSSRSAAPSSLNDPEEESDPGSAAVVERAQRDETPPPAEHPEPAPVAEPVEATAPDPAPSTSSGTGDDDRDQATTADQVPSLPTPPSSQRSALPGASEARGPGSGTDMTDTGTTTDTDTDTAKGAER